MKSTFEFALSDNMKGYPATRTIDDSYFMSKGGYKDLYTYLRKYYPEPNPLRMSAAVAVLTPREIEFLVKKRVRVEK